MAETYSAEYTTLYRTTPPGNLYGYRANYSGLPFTVAHTANGAANDTSLLVKVPPKSRIVVPLSWVRFVGFGANTTVDIGYKAYYDVNGVLVPEDADALVDGLVVSTDGTWVGGSAIVTTAFAGILDLNNRDEVTLFATYLTTAPGTGDVLSGAFTLWNP